MKFQHKQNTYIYTIYTYIYILYTTILCVYEYRLKYRNLNTIFNIPMKLFLWCAVLKTKLTFIGRRIGWPTKFLSGMNLKLEAI